MKLENYQSMETITRALISHQAMARIMAIIDKCIDEFLSFRVVFLNKIFLRFLLLILYSFVITWLFVFGFAIII